MPFVAGLVILVLITLYAFWSTRRQGVATAKISKVLHVKRRHLIPILE